MSVVLQAMEDNDMEVGEKAISENADLIDQVFMLAGISGPDDKIHVSQYDEHIDIARQMLLAKESGMLN